MNHHLRQRNSLERFPGDLVPFPSNTVSSPPTPSRGRTTLLACPPFSRFSLSRGLLSAVFQGSCHWQPPGNNKIPSTAQERKHKLGRYNERTHTLAGMKVLCHTFIFSSYRGYVRGEYSPSHCYSMDMVKLEINILELDPCWNYTRREMSWQQCIVGHVGQTQVTVCMAHIHHYIIIRRWILILTTFQHKVLDILHHNFQVISSVTDHKLQLN